MTESTYIIYLNKVPDRVRCGICGEAMNVGKRFELMTADGRPVCRSCGSEHQPGLQVEVEFLRQCDPRNEGSIHEWENSNGRVRSYATAVGTFMTSTDGTILCKIQSDSSYELEQAFEERLSDQISADSDSVDPS